MAIAPWMKRNSLEIQFWGYEIGNIIASLTGAGGIRAFAAEGISHIQLYFVPNTIQSIERFGAVLEILDR